MNKNSEIYRFLCVPRSYSLWPPESMYHDGRGRALDLMSFMHGRSRMAVDPRIPTMPRRSTSDFHLQCRDGARRVFTDQATIACTKRREMPGE